ncbi:hypothetical protein FOA43_001476 [Brettanomyces nanus]|uniref:Peptide hydrolase n=1 Tax=Eeniella nana TaxID=13502 RepID=A0A875S239_EENNA|nr:uncharacterized protein FOA43_001476 [Brettanomyces nanus]QPG74152.1 hypothetical protein FOA43_001476 [Brettanomyces nanus]
MAPASSFVGSIFRFRKTSLTILLVICYALAIFLSLYFEEVALTVPDPEPRILTQSWLDLKKLACQPHPFTSHANEVAHDFLMGRVSEICERQPYLSVWDDFGNRSTIISQKNTLDLSSPERRVVYFESGNILAKIQGKNPELGGVLVSAHYDSAPPSYGATDDGMGIVTMMGLLEHFSNNSIPQPDRTLIVNLNDNEEFGLMGSEMFIKHPWFSEVKYFVNLDGAGAGGRAVLLRATDNGMLDYYQSVERPFANSMFQQAFKGNLVGSQTDFYVYAKNGLRGIDIDFYKPRSLYHTRRDNVAESSKGSLWHMLKNTLDYVETLVYNAEPLNDDVSDGVYFDVCGKWFFNISVKKLVIVNVTLLLMLPSIIIALLIYVHRNNAWPIGLRGWLRMPISLAISVAVTVVASKYFYIHDKLLILNDFISPLLAISSLALIVNYLVLNFFAWITPVYDQKLICLLELTGLFWVALIFATIVEDSEQNTGAYLATIFFVLLATGSIIGLIGMALKGRYDERVVSVTPPASTYGSTNDEDAGSEEHIPDDTNASTNPSPAVASEDHPLLSPATPEPISSSEVSEIRHSARVEKSYDWLIQFLAVVPLSVFIIFNMGDLLLQSLHQTGQDSAASGQAAIYLLLAVSVSLSIPLLPFAHKMNAAVITFFVLVFAIASTVTYFQVPFSYRNPLKIRTMQVLDLGEASPFGNSSDNAISYMTFRTRKGYITPIISEIPSVETIGEDAVTCKPTRGMNDVETCSYEAQRPWLLDGTVADNAYSKYLSIDVISNSNKGKSSGKYEPLRASLDINVADNRLCILSFNTTDYDSENTKEGKGKSPVKVVTVFDPAATHRQDDPVSANIPSGHSTDDEGNHYFKLMRGIDTFQVYKLNWTEPKHRVALEWLPFSFEDGNDEPSKRGLGVTVKCYWGEFDTEFVVDGQKKRRLPAYDEAVQYAPQNVLYTNMKPGLLEISGHIEL